MYNMDLKELIIFAVILTVIDTIWIRLYMLPKYINWFKTLNLKMSYNYISIFLAYSVMVLIYPLFIKDQDKNKELIKAALIGATVFGLYGFTLAGIFGTYGLDFALIETIWGATLYTVSTFFIQKLS